MVLQVKAAWRVASVVALAFLSACSGGARLNSSVPSPAIVGSGTTPTGSHTVFVSSIGYHSGIIFAREDIPSNRIPEIADFPNAKYIEFGWGDAKAYTERTPDKGVLFRALRALFTPTPAVISILPRNLTDKEIAGGYIRFELDSELMPLSIDDKGLTQLVDYIHNGFDRGEAARATGMIQQPSKTIQFYSAKGSFHLFNTCNTWAARALGAAGLSIKEGGVIGAEGLKVQVRRLPRSQL